MDLIQYLMRVLGAANEEAQADLRALLEKASADESGRQAIRDALEQMENALGVGPTGIADDGRGPSAPGQDLQNYVTKASQNLATASNVQKVSHEVQDDVIRNMRSGADEWGPATPGLEIPRPTPPEDLASMLAVVNRETYEETAAALRAFVARLDQKLDERHGLSPEGQQRLQNYASIASQNMATASNVQKVSYEAQNSAIRNMRGSTEDAQRRIDAARDAAGAQMGQSITGPAKQAWNWQLATGLVVGLFGVVALGGLAAFIGARYLVGGRPISLTPMAVRAAPPSVPYVPLPPPESDSPDADAAAAPGCGLEFLAPVDGQEIAADDALEIQWSETEGAAIYVLELYPPEGTASPWLIETEDTFRQIYMSNFPAAGEYGLAVSALDGDGDPLCSTEFFFSKDAYLLAGQGEAPVTNQPGAGSAPGANVQITPTWDPADTTVDYGSCPGCDAEQPDVIVK